MLHPRGGGQWTTSDFEQEAIKAAKHAEASSGRSFYGAGPQASIEASQTMTSVWRRLRLSAKIGILTFTSYARLKCELAGFPPALTTSGEGLCYDSACV